MDGQPEPQPGRRTNARGAWTFSVVAIIVAVIVIGLLLFASGGGAASCESWEEAKAEWVGTFPPIQQKTKSDLADFQGWVELDDRRVERPDGC